MQIENEKLMRGIMLAANYLLDAEVNFLCGVGRYGRSKTRINMRAGTYDRKLQLRLGMVPLHVPHLRYLHPRPSMLKRFKRLQDDFINTLQDVYANGARVGNVGPLVKLMWTVDLPNEVHAELTQKLCMILEIWRRGYESLIDMHGVKTGGDFFGAENGSAGSAHVIEGEFAAPADAAAEEGGESFALGVI